MTMHQTHNHSKSNSGPETKGATLHKASQYDFHTRLMGLGVNQPNSKMIIRMAEVKSGDKVIDVARKKAKQSAANVVFDVSLIEKLPFPEATFDVVISRLVIHHLPDDLKRQGFAEIFRVLKPGGVLFLADFKSPTNPILAHVTSLLVGHQMMVQSNVSSLPPMLRQAGFADVSSGPTRSSFLAFVSGKK